MPLRIDGNQSSVLDGIDGAKEFITTTQIQTVDNLLHIGKDNTSSTKNQGVFYERFEGGQKKYALLNYKNNKFELYSSLASIPDESKTLTGQVYADLGLKALFANQVYSNQINTASWTANESSNNDLQIYDSDYNPTLTLYKNVGGLKVSTLQPNAGGSNIRDYSDNLILEHSSVQNTWPSSYVKFRVNSGNGRGNLKLITSGASGSSEKEAFNITRDEGDESIVMNVNGVVQTDSGYYTGDWHVRTNNAGDFDIYDRTDSNPVFKIFKNSGSVQLSSNVNNPELTIANTNYETNQTAYLKAGFPSAYSYVKNTLPGANKARLTLGTKNNDSVENDALNILDGNVLIGTQTSNGSDRLQVNGSLSAAGTSTFANMNIAGVVNVSSNLNLNNFLLYGSSNSMSISDPQGNNRFFTNSTDTYIQGSNVKLRYTNYAGTTTDTLTVNSSGANVSGTLSCSTGVNIGSRPWKIQDSSGDFVIKDSDNSPSFQISNNGGMSFYGNTSSMPFIFSNTAANSSTWIGLYNQSGGATAFRLNNTSSTDFYSIDGTLNIFTASSSGTHNITINPTGRILVKGASDDGFSSLQISDTLRLVPRATAPASASNGMMYVNSTSNTLQIYLNGTWRTVSAT